ncbi:uncharacterized protein LDX57_010513 [Aspergillus melleus]|uniref:uncharacterized protein n=1 Tax=Aspergillus melleus TaxID=138277 RepID=UPI001E8DA140|nr:uncharacterized protein LDX57_010513 [Aspergillus melleus]KAH8432880.1 hypothetical protein LDX57_010513 [Aspergillus melleus]
MATNTLDQPVQVNDLILAYDTKKCYMLLVKFALDNQQTNPLTSSVFVQKVNWHVPDLEGYWVLDGPRVYYSHYGTENEDYKYCLCDKHSNNNPETRLDLFLYSMASSDDKQGSQANRGFTLIVKPHGRDVLKHYFNGWCPNCGDEGCSVLDVGRLKNAFRTLEAAVP